MDHFEKKDEAEAKKDSPSKDGPKTPNEQQSSNPPAQTPQDPAANAHLQKQLEQISGQASGSASNEEYEHNTAKYQKSLLDGDLEFVCYRTFNVMGVELFQLLLFLQLKYLSRDELKSKMSNLDHDMEREIEDLRRRYHAKRQPILDAMDQKRKRQQNF